MSIERLTKRSIDATAPGSANVFIWDSELSGFGLKVTPTGRKVFILQYRIPGYGRRASAKRMTLGEYGTLTPDEARKLAKRELGRVAQGFDPGADRASMKGALTVKQLGEAYLEEVRIRRKPTTAAEYTRLWDKHVVVALGSKPVKEVALADLRRLHRSLHATPYIANRLVAMLGAFFTFAEHEGVRGLVRTQRTGSSSFRRQRASASLLRTSSSGLEKL